MTIMSRCWLLELAQSAPPGWELQGFDVSTAQFPAKEYLPQNIQFRVLDAFGEVPEELLCRFDIVHIRAFAVVVKQGTLDALLVHLVRLLSMYRMIALVSIAYCGSKQEDRVGLIDDRTWRASAMG